MWISPFYLQPAASYLLLVLSDYMVEEVALGARRVVRLQVVGEEHERPAAVLKHGPLAAFVHFRLAERANADEDLERRDKAGQAEKLGG